MDQIQTGYIYKEQTVLKKRYQKRYFVLKNKTLSYYKNANDASLGKKPRGQMDVTSHVITTKKKGHTSTAPHDVNDGGDGFFYMTITSPTKTYQLRFMSSEAQSTWMNVFSKLKTNAASVETVLMTPRLPPSVPSTPINPTSAVIRHRYVGKVDDLVARFMKTVHSSVWEPNGSRNGVSAFKNPESGSVAMVKGIGRVNFPINRIATLLMDPSLRHTYDPLLDTAATVEVLSEHSQIFHFQFKAIFPAAARDFVNLVHWRMLPNGSIVLLAESLPSNDPVDGAVTATKGSAVRGHVHMGGWLLEPEEGGVKITMVVRVDLKGKIPTWVVQQVTSQQVYSIRTIGKVLETSKHVPFDLPPMVNLFDFETPATPSSPIAVVAMSPTIKSKAADVVCSNCSGHNHQPTVTSSSSFEKYHLEIIFCLLAIMAFQFMWIAA